MAVFKGSITATAWYVQGDVPDDFRDRFSRALDVRAFRDIAVEGEDRESFGWVTLADAFDTSFSSEKWLFQRDHAWLAVRLRHDTLKVPPTTFALHLEKARAAYLADHGRDRLTKSEEESLRDLLEKDLRRRVLPTTRVHEVVWDLDRGEVWLGTSNRRVGEVFEELFHKTFGLPLVPRNVYSRLERAGLGDDALEAASELEPTVFAIRPD
jgi:DNA recombination-dependent growth factor C